MISSIVSGIVNGIFQAAFGWISRYLERRGLIAEGKSTQYQADLAATVKAGTNAEQIRDQVQTADDSQLDRALEQLQHDKPSSGL